MTTSAAKPEPFLRFAGRRLEDGVSAPAPLQLAVALRDYAMSCGLTIEKLERSRVRISGSIYLVMTEACGRRWIMRLSNHRRGRRTSHATPHVDLISLDGVAGLRIGRGLIDAIVAGTMPWFDATATVRPLPQVRRNVKRRRR